MTTEVPASGFSRLVVKPGAEYFLRFRLMSDFFRLHVLLSFLILLPAASANLVSWPGMGRLAAAAAAVAAAASDWDEDANEPT